MALSWHLSGHFSRFVNALGEKEGRRFFYTAGANVCVIALSAALLALFYTFQPFIRPLLWAALCGCVLHPVKQTCSRATRHWLQDARKSSGGLLLHVVVLPVQVVRCSVEALDGLVKRRWKMLLLSGVATIVLLVGAWCGGQFVVSMAEGVWRMLDVVCMVLDYLQAFHVWTLALAYFLVVIFWRSPNTSFLSYLSFPVWFLLIIWSTGFIPSKFYRLLTVTMAVIFLCIGYFSHMNGASSSPDMSVQSTDSVGDDQPDNTTKHPALKKSRRKRGKLRTQLTVSFFHTDGNATDGSNGSIQLSGQYFIALIWACVVVKILQNLWLLMLLPIVVLILVAYNVFIYCEVLEGIQQRWMESEIKEQMSCWLDRRRDVLLPPPVRGMFQLLQAVDRQVARWLEKWVDYLTSLFVIGCVLVMLLSVSVFLVVQVHGEAVHLAMGTNQLWNDTVANSPDIHRWVMSSLEESGVQSALDSAVAKGYSFGREWITKKVRELFSSQAMNTTKLENDLLSAYDKLYNNLWTDTSNGSSMRASGLESLSALWSDLFEDSVQLSDIVPVIKENLDTLSTVLKSVWTLLASNVTIAFDILMAILWLVFTSGTTVLNFLISLIIFFTTLFYLLASPGEEYRLLQYISSLVPVDSNAESRNSKDVMSRAVRGVFGAALKMASFYGLFSWLIHTVFGIHVVIIPSAFSAVFAAIPFIGTYWVAVPGSVYLWLTGHEVYAALFLFFHFLPVSFVDTAIYGGIEGGAHPYITGLAIAGGMYWFGLEGAIIGPLLLCCILVTLDVYHRYMDKLNEESSPMQSTPRKHMLNRSLSAVEPGDLSFQ